MKSEHDDGVNATGGFDYTARSEAIWKGRRRLGLKRVSATCSEEHHGHRHDQSGSSPDLVGFRSGGTLGLFDHDEALTLGKAVAGLTA